MSSEGHSSQTSSMAASAVLLAWAGLASVSGAPQLFPANTNGLVTRVISGLNVQGAVAQALAGGSQGVSRRQEVTRTRTQGSAGEWSEWSTVTPSSQVTLNTFPSSPLTTNTRFTFIVNFSQQTLELLLYLEPGPRTAEWRLVTGSAVATMPGEWSAVC